MLFAMTDSLISSYLHLDCVCVVFGGLFLGDDADLFKHREE